MKKLLLTLVIGFGLVGCSSSKPLTKEEYVNQAYDKLTEVKTIMQTTPTEDGLKGAIDAINEIATTLEATAALQGPEENAELEKAFDESLTKTAEAARNLAKKASSDDTSSYAAEVVTFSSEFMGIFTNGDKIDSKIGLSFTETE